MKNSPCILFAGSSNITFATEIISKSDNIKLGEIYHHTFPNGEYYVQFKENIRGSDVFLIQTANGNMDSNSALMQLLIMADAARRASAGRITAVCPAFFYQRQDRKDRSRVPISAKLVMDIMAAAGINRIITMDLHAQQLQGFTNLPLDHLYFQPTLIEALKSLKLDVVVSPDLGAVKKASEYSDKTGLDLAFLIKKRKNDVLVEMSQFVGNIKDKRVIILDDLTESAGTLVEAATVCKAQGASEVYCAVTHGCLSELGILRMTQANENGIINQFYCSNTVTEHTTSNRWATIVSVADVFAKAILGIHNNTSITKLFN